MSIFKNIIYNVISKNLSLLTSVITQLLKYLRKTFKFPAIELIFLDEDH